MEPPCSKIWKKVACARARLPERRQFPRYIKIVLKPAQQNIGIYWWSHVFVIRIN